MLRAGLHQSDKLLKMTLYGSHCLVGLTTIGRRWTRESIKLASSLSAAISFNLLLQVEVDLSSQTAVLTLGLAKTHLLTQSCNVVVRFDEVSLSLLSRQ